jgi:hypothetical protein
MVIVRQDQTIELIQCKHYSGTIGPKVLKQELAKLCVSVFSGALPKRPNVVTFPVSTDLTAAAVDFLRDPASWRNAATPLVRRANRGRNDPDLLNFSLKWWPSPRHQTGAQLTVRARTYPDLIGMFFELKTVVDPEKTAAMQRTIDRFMEVEALPRYQKAVAGIGELIAETERRNPGILVKAAIASTGMDIEVFPKPGIGAIPYGTLTVMSDGEGRQGREKFQELIEKGKEAKLVEGEFLWDSSLDLSPLDPPKGRLVELRVSRDLPTPAVPVRLLCRRYDKTIVSIPYATARLVRFGDLESEISITGGKLAGEIRLILDSSRQTAHFSLKPNYSEHPSAMALLTARLLFNLKRGGEFFVESIEKDARILSMRTKGTGSKDGGFLVRLLEWLCTVNQAFSSDIRLPQKVTQEMAAELQTCAVAIRRGKLIHQRPAGTVAVTLTQQGIDALLANRQSTEPLNLFATGEATFSLFGTTLPPVEQRIMFAGVQPIQSHQEIEKMLESPFPEDGLRIEFRPKKVIREFPAWLKLDSSLPFPPAIPQ